MRGQHGKASLVPEEVHGSVAVEPEEKFLRSMPVRCRMAQLLMLYDVRPAGQYLGWIPVSAVFEYEGNDEKGEGGRDDAGEKHTGEGSKQLARARALRKTRGTCRL